MAGPPVFRRELRTLRSLSEHSAKLRPPSRRRQIQPSGSMTLRIPRQRQRKHTHTFGHFLERNFIRTGENVARVHAIDLKVVFVVGLNYYAFQFQTSERTFAS